MVNSLAYACGLCVCLSVSNVAVLWLNTLSDQFDFWCEAYIEDSWFLQTILDLPLQREIFTEKWDTGLSGLNHCTPSYLCWHVRFLRIMNSLR